MFKVGQKVVCIDDSNSPNLAPLPITKGDIYTINGITSCSCSHVSIDIGLRTINSHRRCKGCSERALQHGIRWASASRFAPLQEDDNYATETLKDIRILQLEHELSELKQLTNEQTLSNTP